MSLTARQATVSKLTSTCASKACTESYWSSLQECLPNGRLWSKATTASRAREEEASRAMRLWTKSGFLHALPAARLGYLHALPALRRAPMPGSVPALPDMEVDDDQRLKGNSVAKFVATQLGRAKFQSGLVTASEPSLPATARILVSCAKINRTERMTMPRALCRPCFGRSRQSSKLSS